MREHLRRDARLRAQTRNRHDRGRDAADGCARGPPRRVGQQRAVVRVQDVHGQVRVRVGQLVVQLALEGAVDRVPEGAAARADVRDVGRAGGAGGRARERVGDGGWEARFEGVEAVDRAGDAVEADAFQADFAHELGDGDGFGGGLRVRGQVEEGG